MSETTVERRLVPDRLDQPLWRRLMRWETLLAAIAIAVFALNSFASPYFLDPWALSDLTFTFTEKGLIALPMALLIISGEFDLSVAAIMALASTLMGMAAEAGAGTPLLVIIGVLVGLLCGAGNGLLVAYFRLPSIVGTIGTMSLFRGIAFIILGDQAYQKYPAGLAYFGQGYVWSVISFELALFVLAAIVYGFVLAWHELWTANLCHWRKFGGRSLFRRSGRPDQVSALLLDRSDVWRRGRAHHIAPWLDAALDCSRVRARRNHHGGVGRRQHPGRGRIHSGRRARGLHHGIGDLRSRSSQCTQRRHVDCRRNPAHRRHRIAACLAKGDAQANGLKRAAFGPPSRLRLVIAVTAPASRRPQ